MKVPGTRQAGTRERLRIDASKCEGKGVCVQVAPDLFALDRFGYAFVREGAQQRIGDDRGQYALAREAIVKCPHGAIRLDPAGPERHPEPPAVPVAIRAFQPRLLSGDDAGLAVWLGDGPSDPGAILAAVERAGISGQGGSGFPAAAKWRSLGPGQPVVIANAAEREPGTVKDRTLLARRPEVFVAGLLLTAVGVGAKRAVVAIDVDHADDLVPALEPLLDEARGLSLGAGVEVEIGVLPARYVAGEETGLIAALEGGPPNPRIRPPHPTTRGLRGQPTIVHNVETLAAIALAWRHGVDWFRAAGTAAEPGSGLFSVGVLGETTEAIEAPFGVSVDELLALGGLTDRPMSGVLVGGWSGGILRPDQLGVATTRASLHSVGAALGTKAISLISANECPVGVVQRIVAYFAGESSGQCPPCADGLPYIAAELAALELGEVDQRRLDEMQSFAASVPGRGGCALPDGAVRMVASLLSNFDVTIRDHLDGGCPWHTGEQS